MATRRHPRTFLPRAFAEVDLHRRHRLGAPEIIYGAGKTVAQIVAIARKLKAENQPVLVTRVDPAKARQLRRKLPAGQYHPHARTYTWKTRRKRPSAAW